MRERWRDRRNEKCMVLLLYLCYMKYSTAKHSQITIYDETDERGREAEREREKERDWEINERVTAFILTGRNGLID